MQHIIMMLLKKRFMMNQSQTLLIRILWYLVLEDQFVKHNMIQQNIILKKRFKLIIRRYLILIDQLKKLITTQKLQILKMKYLILVVQLLLALLIQKLQRLKTKYQIKLIQLPKLFLIQNLQKVKINYLIPYYS